MSDAPTNHPVIRAVMAVSFIAMLTAAVLYFSSHPGLTTAAQTNAQADSSHAEGSPEASARAAVEAHLSSLMQQLQSDPENVSVMLSITEHFLDMNDFAMAEKFSQRALGVQPSNSDALYLRGISRHSLGRNEEAAQDFEASLAIREEPSIRYSLGILYAYFLNNPERGRSELNKALSIPGLPPDLADMARKELTRLDGQSAAQQPPKSTQVPEQQPAAQQSAQQKEQPVAQTPPRTK